MLEYEIASIIKFTLDSAGNPAPYYNEVKENFIVPSLYFPSPEIDTDGDTLSTYRMRYRWNIKVFHKTTEDAYSTAFAVLSAFKRARNLVPIINEEGQATGRFLRILDPEIKKIDSGAYHIVIEWDSRRPYEDPVPILMQEYYIKEWPNAPLYTEPNLTNEKIEEAKRAAADK